MPSIQESYAYPVSEYSIPVNRTSSKFGKFIANFRFAGKMLILAGLIVLCTVAGNIWTALRLRDIRRNFTRHGQNQVNGLHSLLSMELKRNPAHFIETARHALNDTRWEQDNSGYAFLLDRQGKMLIYPPDASREGGMLDPVQVNDHDENINQAFARIGRGDTPESITCTLMETRNH